MLMLDKKRISYIIISIILGFSIFIIGKQQNLAIPTSSVPVSQHTVVLDAGHGQPDRTAQLVILAFPKSK